jgi:hypothetical protein
MVCDRWLLGCRSRSLMLHWPVSHGLLFFLTVGHGLWCLSVTVCDACRSRSVMPVGHGLWCLSVTVCYVLFLSVTVCENMSVTVCDACRSRSVMLFCCRSRSVMPVGHGPLCFFCCRSRSVMFLGHGLWGGGVQISTLKLQHSLSELVSQKRQGILADTPK